MAAARRGTHQVLDRRLLQELLRRFELRAVCGGGGGESGRRSAGTGRGRGVGGSAHTAGSAAPPRPSPTRAALPGDTVFSRMVMSSMAAAWRLRSGGGEGGGERWGGGGGGAPGTAGGGGGGGGRKRAARAERCARAHRAAEGYHGRGPPPRADALIGGSRQAARAPIGRPAPGGGRWRAAGRKRGGGASGGAAR